MLLYYVELVKHTYYVHKYATSPDFVDRGAHIKWAGEIKFTNVQDLAKQLVEMMSRPADMIEYFKKYGEFTPNLKSSLHYFIPVMKKLWADIIKQYK